ILSVCQRIHPGLGIAAEGILCGRLLALRSLGEAGFSVRDPLIKGDVESARQAVSMIVGRDTERLDAEGIAKAAVETVAENTSDGVTAPLFYMILFGGAGGIFYKAVNTMDSMIGYKNDRYRFFGTAAARLDDVMNYVPSRLTALLMILSCAVPFRGALARTSSPGRLSTLDALSAETPPASGTVSAAASPSASGRIPAEGSLPASGRNPAEGSLPASGSVSSAEAFPPAPAAVSAAEQQRKRKTGAQKPAGERVLPDMRAAFSVWRRDRAKSPSPNSAQTESVCAGALHLRLLGDTWYFGELHHKDEIGDGARKVEPADITRAVYLMVRASILLFAAGIAALALFSGI
ncbi:MAG: adenosylcobinamide-phosphate synthase CbiB, partial [Eubacteriales bacterium]|nr:adenosylcobinamide-phosphate synthase CbiB [Eubacteriales bacterium]